MIQDLDDTLKELMVQKVPVDPAVIDIKFDMPTREWASGVSRPTLNAFLYDLRENHEVRSNERFLARNGATGTERRAPVRMDFTYLITAWTADVSDEHRLLGQVLLALLRYPLIPEEVLVGAMQTQPLQAWIAQPERTPHAWDFWGVLEGRLKAGISYVVTASLEPFPAEDVRLVTQTSLKLQPLT